MTSDSVASFLDLARDQGLLPREQVEDLCRQPDMPQSGLHALCAFLEKRGVLTAYQAEKIRRGRGSELTFAGYPILGEFGPCPGGTAYKATHPSLRTPLIVRRLRADWLAPNDNISAYVQRAQAAAPVTHPNLGHLLDAGVSQDEAFVVLEPFNGGDLESLIADIGPMPANLAAEYGRQAVMALESAHGRGIVHGDVRPASLMVGPIVASARLKPDGTPRMRPAPNASVKLMELGLVPLRPTATGDYLPPERASNPTPTAAGDVYMLGASLYYLLTARSPATVAPLGTLRPDMPAPFTALVEEMMAEKPTDRPTIRQCVAALQSLAKGRAPSPRISDSGDVKLTAVPEADVELVNAEPGEVELVEMEVEPAPAEFADHTPEPFGAQRWGESNNYWAHPAPADFVPAAFDAGQYATPSQQSTPALAREAPKPKRSNRQQMYLWIGAGLLLNLAAVVIWYFVFFNGSGSGDQESGTPPPKIEKKDKKKNKSGGA